jgi:valyl-tRNA synthetase
MEENQISKTYNAQEWEDKLYALWEKSGFFNPDECIKQGVTKTDAPSFSVLMPPPNVTGVLHLGHAMENSIMDTIARYERMRGFRTLFLPGADHAAVATQARVEKNLIEKEGYTNPRQELGREKLLDKIRTYADESKTTIIKQIRAMGSSADWSRFAYTFDDKRILAVNTVFQKMYADGLIYKGYRVVNWSVKGQSTCSDDELVHIERPAKLYTFRYAKDFPIAIATTRPETKLGDTAVAVHPNDKRYKKYIGQTFTVDIGAKAPLEIKIIGEEGVDPNFGTGAVGVTPAHSQTDFDMRERHNEIDLLSVIGQDGKMTENAGAAYAHLPVSEAREKFIIWLRKNNLLEKEEDVTQNVGTSDRFGDVVEVLPMHQWFVAVNKEIPERGKSLKDLMREAVTTGLDNDISKKVSIQPERFTKTYLHWIDNLRDWCISRQIWWGHRIPVWYCLSCKKESVGATPKSRWYFVRHGETETNKQQINTGQTDVPLNETGRKQAELAADTLTSEKIETIFSSHLSRAYETATIIGKKIGVDEIITDERLQERNMGETEGLSYSDAKKQFPSLYTYNGKPANNESYQEAEERIWEAISEHLEKHSHKNVLIVSHGAVLRSLFRRIKNIDPQDIRTIAAFPNASPLSLDILEPCKHCGGHFFEQDPDTLDTWFSSGLWTFSTLGWPAPPQNKQEENKSDLSHFHPTSFMQMGHEILFFWMARMILMTAYTLETIPFKDVYIHGVLRDEDGKKFSKSLGNGVDPLEVSGKYGTDALRLALLSDVTPGNDSRFSYDKVENNRNFVNKLWNIARYILSSSDEKASDPQPQSPADHFILQKLSQTIHDVSTHLDQYNFSLAIQTLREFTWNHFADWYVEIHKVEKNDELLRSIFATLLKLSHPFVPFVTEALFQTFSEKKSSHLLMVQKWPASESSFDENQAALFDATQKLIIGIRNARALYHIDPVKEIAISTQKESYEILVLNEALFKKFGRIDEIRIITNTKPKQCAFVQAGKLQVYIHLEELIDINKEKTRLEKERSSAEQYMRSIKKRLSDSAFTAKAPAHVIEQNEKSLAETSKKISELSLALEKLVS